MHRIGCEYLMPAVIIAFPFIKVYSWKKYTALRLWAVYFLFLWAVRSGAQVRKVSLGSVPRADTRKSVCGAGFGEWLAMGNCSKKRFFSIRDQDRAVDEETGCFGDSQNELRCKNNGIGEETARRARKRGVFEIHKTNYVVKTTELGRKPRAGRGNGVFSGITKRITLLKQRNSQRNRAVDEGKGCFWDSQNEFRC